MTEQASVIAHLTSELERANEMIRELTWDRNRAQELRRGSEEQVIRYLSERETLRREVDLLREALGLIVEEHELGSDLAAYEIALKTIAAFPKEGAK
jgi:hypothetical protein